MSEKVDNVETYKLQISNWDWYQDDIDTEDDEPVYTIMIFGRTSDDKSIYIKVKGYTPYFYIKIPENWKQ